MPVEVVNVRTYRGPVIYVGRGGPWRWPQHPLGNPFRLPRGATEADREECLQKYRDWLVNHASRDALLDDLVREYIETKWPLGCWCKPAICHADVLAEEIERRIRHG